MSDAAQVVERLLNTDGVHAFVLVCEAADKYSPMIDSLVVVLANGRQVKVTEIDKDVGKKIDETRKTLKREDRIVWALRFYKKALASECLWMAKYEPQYFKKKFGAVPSPEQPILERQLAKLADVDITPFQEAEEDDPEHAEPPYTGFSTIDAINTRLGDYIEVAETFGAADKDNLINRVMLTRQSFGEVVSAYRRAEIAIRRRYAAVLNIWPSREYRRTEKHPEVTYVPAPKADMCDAEGPISTVMEFPNGWRWFDLNRNCSYLRDEMLSKHPIRKNMATGHCGNTAGKGDCTVLTLEEPLGDNRWNHHAFFVLYHDGQLGERKGKFNQKPSPKLWKYIFELLKHDKRIKGLGRNRGYGGANDFQLEDLPKPWLAQLKKARPDMFPDEDEDEQAEF